MKRNSVHRISGCLTVAGLCSALVAGAAPGRAQQDPRHLLEKVSAAYQTANTYSSTSSVLAFLTYHNEIVNSQSMTIEMRMQRPNRLYIGLQMPGGSRYACSDGKNFTVYNASTNQYTKDPTAATLANMLLPLVFAKAGIEAGVDPLYFLSRKGLPPQLADLHYTGETTLDGVRVFCVTGVSKTPVIMVKLKSGGHASIPAATQYWSWWIDEKTFLLKKVEESQGGMNVKLPFRDKKRTVMRTVSATQVIRHTVASAQVNGALPDNAFPGPPRGARLRRSMSDLMK